MPGSTRDTAGAFTDPAVRDRLADLPPSAKLVARVLSEAGGLSQAELVEETLLPSRTVRYALSRLEEADLLDDRHSFRDARKREYDLVRPQNLDPRP